MKVLTRHIQNLITTNQLELLKKTCDDLFTLNKLMKPTGLPLFQKNALLMPQDLGSLSPEMAASIARLFYPDPHSRFDYLFRLYDAQNFLAGQLLIQDDLPIADLANYSMYSKEHTKHLVTAQSHLAKLQRALTKSDFSTIDTLVGDILSWNTRIFGEWINKITTYQLPNPFPYTQWIQLLSGQFKSRIMAQIDLEKYAQYTHPDELASEFDKQELVNIHSKVDAEIQKLFNEKELQQHEIAILNQYFQNPSSMDLKTVTAVSKLLDERQMTIEFYRNNPRYLSAKKLRQAKDYFSAQLNKKWIERKQSLQVTGVVTLTDFANQTTSSTGLFSKFADLSSSIIQKKADIAELAALILRVKELPKMTTEVKGLFWLQVLNKDSLEFIRKNQADHFIPLLQSIIQNPMVISNKRELEYNCDFILEDYLLVELTDEEISALLVADEHGFFDKKHAAKLLLENKPNVAMGCFSWLQQGMELTQFINVAKKNHLALFEFLVKNMEKNNNFLPATLEEFCNTFPINDNSYNKIQLLTKLQKSYFMAFVNALATAADLSYLQMLISHPLFVVEDIEFYYEEAQHGVHKMINTQISPLALAEIKVFFPALSAARAGKVEMLKYLFEHEKTKPYFTGQKILMLLGGAMQNGHFEATDYLLAIMPDELIIPEYFLSFCYQEEHFPVLEKLLNSNRMPINTPEFVEQLYLYAGTHDFIKLLKHVIAKGNLSSDMITQLVTLAIDKAIPEAIDLLITLPGFSVNQLISINQHTKTYEKTQLNFLMYAIETFRMNKNMMLRPASEKIVKKLLNCKDIDFSYTDSQGRKTLVDYCLIQEGEINLDRIALISDLIALDTQLKLIKLESSLEELSHLITNASKLNKYQYYLSGNSDYKLLENAKVVKEKLLAHWLKQMLLIDDEASTLLFKPASLIQKTLEMISAVKDPLVTNEMRLRAKAICALITVIDFLKNNRIFAFEARVRSYIEASLKHRPEILSEFLKHVSANKTLNPLYGKAWQLFQGQIHFIARQNVQLVQKIDFVQLQISQFAPGASSSSSSSSASNTKIQECADELIKKFENYSEDERAMIRSLFEPNASSLELFTQQQKCRVEARKLLEQNQISLVLQIDEDQSENATKLLNELVFNALKPKSEKVIAMSATSTPATLLAQSSSILNAPANPPVEQQSQKEAEENSYQR